MTNFARRTQMANFSQDPGAVLTANWQKGYVSAYIEQGVPVLDRDLNLIHDLIATMVRSLFTNYIGNGVAANSSTFRIVTNGAANDFRIEGPGVFLVNGWD